MSEFSGFPARMQFTAVPNVFFSSLLPQIDDINELKAVLLVFEVLYRKKGSLHFTTLNELSGYPGWISREALKKALEDAVRRGIILHLEMERAGNPENIYFLNTDNNKQAIERIGNGELALEGLKAQPRIPVNPEELPDIFVLYEQNVGMLTPLIAEELQDWKKHYPEDWIREAIKEAVVLNKRNPRYIERILERWSSEGKGDGTYRGNLKKNTDPDKYIKGKYGHIVRR